MVSDLIDPGSNSWKANIINAGFHREDADTILSISLSHFGCEDRLVWHHFVNGVYSVKSGYGVAMDLLVNGALGKKGRGAPSEQQQLNQVWSRIWRLQAPNKIKLFIWRCCSNALAVQRNLQIRHMRVDNVCGVDFLESWGKFHECVKGRENADEICQEFAFGLWRLWKNRNDVVFNGLHRQPLEVVDLWRKNINEFRAASASVEGDDWAKEKTHCAGVGWVGRDFAGVLQAAGGLGTVLCHSADAAEAIAIRTALAACINHRFNHVFVESDAKLIIQMIRKEVSADFSLDCVLGDIKILARKLTLVTFAFVPRESNHAAHLVAKYVFKEG
ncbi:uncharacterized protein LOC126617159 [Malus sylvestris]|uniref:uncharacterized protein LOC126617159 n=1 Tax=Malus sylvestris TaxID=3752 RepID=UPI0021ABB98E|nr:uncharacterized protein LOC126617159 [Malus sylvestris]